MVREEHKANRELEEFCDKAGGEIRETLADDNDQVHEGCVIGVDNDLATVVTPGGYSGDYQIQFGKFGDGRENSRYGHHRETVLNPQVVMEVNDLEEASMPPYQMEWKDVEYVSLPRDSDEQFL